ADYRAEKIHYEKIKKSDQDLELRLVRNPDIVSEVSQKKRPQDVVIGFAAQSSDLEHHAKNKMEKKQLDMIVGNLVHQEQKGFGNVHNDFYLLTKSNHQWCKNMGKDQVAKAILDEIENLIEAKLHS
ncbi:MAG: hypothetical protein KDD52_05075, partial [Bdellovibrionales bacterium]|nr:hypothetical protein [Bdellovibrionales bacterium]